MSTQTAPSIRLTHTSPQQGLRLLELPRELLDVLSSDNAPPLELKYLPPSTTTTTTQKPQNQPEQEYINLCTPTKTYRVRQVQSSNSIHVLQPSNGDDEQVGADDNDNENDAMEYEDEDEEGQNLASGIPTPSMTSIAKCSSTLELHTPQEGFSAVPFLLSMLRVYDRLSSEGGLSGGIGIGGGLARGQGQGQRDDDDDDDDDGDDDATSLTKDRVFADIPVCKAQCERDWDGLCAFVCGGSGKSFGDHSGHGYGYGNGNCWRPSALVKLDVWKRVMEGAVLQGVNLEKQFLVGDLWKAMVDDEDGSEMVPRGLFEAVIRRVSEVGEGEGEGGNDYESELKWTNIDKATCVRWVGETYLEAMSPMADTAIGRSEFLAAWKDHLPESWRDEVALSKLPDDCYKLPDPTSICYLDYGERQKVKKLPSTEKNATAAAKKTRNWHELFKGQRRR